MDPYLEDGTIWPGFHHRLADEIADRLNAHIGPKYYADVNVRTLFEEVTIVLPHAIYPDVGVFERRGPEPVPGPAVAAVTIPSAPVQRTVIVAEQVQLRAVQVYLTETGELVTSIEILSPYNKQPGEGLEEYRRKRRRLLLSLVHLVEIDLLRSGERPGREVNEPPLNADYVLLVNRRRSEGEVRISEIWPVTLGEPLPLLPIPLLAPDPDVPLDLNAAIQAVYARAGYDWRINYRRPVPLPELRPEAAAWLKQHLPHVGVREGE